MYFWKIDALKRELASPTVSDRYALPYLLWLGGTELAGYALSDVAPPNLWDRLISVVGLAAFLVGTLYAFRCNGGATGSQFLTRYISLSWVLGIRIVVFVLAPLVACVLAIESAVLGELPEHTTPFAAAAGVAYSFAFYLRLATHIREVATRSGAA